MSDKTMVKKVNEIKTLESQKKAIEKQIAELQDSIKKELEARGQEEARAGDWVVRFKSIVNNKFNTKAFAADHPRLYQKYMAPAQSMRFTIGAQGL